MTKKKLFLLLAIISTGLALGFPDVHAASNAEGESNDPTRLLRRDTPRKDAGSTPKAGRVRFADEASDDESAQPTPLAQHVSFDKNQPADDVGVRVALKNPPSPAPARAPKNEVPGILKQGTPGVAQQPGQASHGTLEMLKTHKVLVGGTLASALMVSAITYYLWRDYQEKKQAGRVKESILGQIGLVGRVAS